MKKVAFALSMAAFAVGPAVSPALADYPDPYFCTNQANNRCDALVASGEIAPAERGQCWRDYFNDCMDRDLD